MSENTRPLARIRLPAHHPALQGMKNGGKIVVHGQIQDTQDDVPITQPEGMPKPPKRERPMPLERTVHVTHIMPMKERGAGGNMAEAVGYLKKQQGRNSMQGGRDVS